MWEVFCNYLIINTCFSGFLPLFKAMNAVTTKNDESNWSHDRLQAECIQWHHNEFEEDRHLLHTNLNNSVGGRRGVYNTALGIKKGRSDAEYFKAGKLYLFEFKVGSDRQKADQKAFQIANEKEGAIYFIIYSKAQYEGIIEGIRQAAKLLN